MASTHAPLCWRNHWAQGCRPTVVGISGQKQAGKDTVAEALQRVGFTRLGFADALKQEVRTRLRGTILAIGRLYPPALDDWTDESRLSRLIHEKPEPIRLLLQEYGTEVRRVDAPDYWVRAWETAWRARGALPVVIPDCRYQNELEAVQALHGAFLRVDRPLLRDTDPHPSEHGWRTWDRWDHVLVNDGSIEDLQARVLSWWGAFRWDQ